MLEKLSLPQTLKQLSTTIGESIPIDSWSGAVNMLLVEDYMVFIKRSDSMPTHKGQMGFMGGHKHDGEDDPLVTALRELEEETGFGPNTVRQLGLIEPVYTSSGRVIIPVLGKSLLTAMDFLKNVQPNEEWDELILTPLSHLADPNNWQVAQINDSKQRVIGFCPLRTNESLTFPQDTAAEFLLWGATAKMVWNFFKCYE